MSNIQQQEVLTFIANYAEVLNSGNSELITYFFADRGLFMPDGYPTFTVGEKFKKSSTSFFRKNTILINYEINDISITGNFAFVNSNATTITTDLTSNEKTIKDTRDFFVLQSESGEWKILRYIFNNK